MLPVVRLWPLRPAGESYAGEVTGETGNVPDRGQNHGKDKYLNKVLGGVTVNCLFAQSHSFGIFGNREGLLSGHQRLIAHQPT